MFATFDHGHVYHHVKWEQSPFRAEEVPVTLCGVLLTQPYPSKHGEMITSYVGGTEFPTLHETVPSGLPVCSVCERRLGR